MKRLVLLGAGHAHRVALRQFARDPLPETELVVSPSRWQYYSGMIPGWLGGRRLRADAVLVSTGGRALPFLGVSGLAVDEAGFVRVDACHRSTFHHNVFVAGDACSRIDQRLDRSGVHAVRAGPILARNLAAAISGKPLTRFYPRRFSLCLLAAGDCTAIGNYGLLTFSGAWLWKWKDRIDRGFVDNFPGA